MAHSLLAHALSEHGIGRADLEDVLVHVLGQHRDGQVLFTFGVSVGLNVLLELGTHPRAVEQARHLGVVPGLDRRERPAVIVKVTHVLAHRVGVEVADTLGEWLLCAQLGPAEKHVRHDLLVVGLGEGHGLPILPLLKQLERGGLLIHHLESHKAGHREVAPRLVVLRNIPPRRLAHPVDSQLAHQHLPPPHLHVAVPHSHLRTFRFAGRHGPCPHEVAGQPVLPRSVDPPIATVLVR
mmetsp:Transcript_86623/g.245110  ORF Transcript_86623/g.245110 Transcript_86623/m.245110 type:complete len:238 (-) Transcript_86623:957-1670(-)